MDRRTYASITNCIKELDSLEKLIVSSRFGYEEIADWVAQISWELSRVFQHRAYNSDEFQLKLSSLISKIKEESSAPRSGNWKNKMFDEDASFQCDCCTMWHPSGASRKVCADCGADVCSTCVIEDVEDGLLCPECFKIPAKE